METKIEEVIKALAEKSVKADESHEAMQFAQAVLNLAHSLQIIHQAKK